MMMMNGRHEDIKAMLNRYLAQVTESGDRGCYVGTLSQKPEKSDKNSGEVDAGKVANGVTEEHTI